MSKYQIQKVYTIHDWAYASYDLIPQVSFDGKDIVTEQYIIVTTPIVEEDCGNLVSFDTYHEALEELKEILLEEI